MYRGCKKWQLINLPTQRVIPCCNEIKQANWNSSSPSYESKGVNLHLESGRGVDFHRCVKLVEDLESDNWQSSLKKLGGKKEFFFIEFSRSWELNLCKQNGTSKLSHKTRWKQKEHHCYQKTLFHVKTTA